MLRLCSAGRSLLFEFETSFHLLFIYTSKTTVVCDVLPAAKATGRKPSPGLFACRVQLNIIGEALSIISFKKKA
jgi:hypothetical protein